MKISIGFSRHPSSFISRIISLVEKTHFSHTYIRFHDIMGKDMVFQASDLKVNLQSYVNFDIKNDTVAEFDFDVSEDMGMNMLLSAFDKLGMNYAFSQLLGFSLVKFLAKFGIKIQNPFHDGRSNYVCSELVGEFLSTYFNAKFDDLDTLSPKDVYDYLVKSKEVSYEDKEGSRGTN